MKRKALISHMQKTGFLIARLKVWTFLTFVLTKLISRLNGDFGPGMVPGTFSRYIKNKIHIFFCIFTFITLDIVNTAEIVSDIK